MIATGQTIKVNGTVEGSLYAGSSLIELGEKAVIGRNMYYGGFGLLTQPGSKVGRDLLVGAYQLQHSGEVGRDLMAGLAALEMNGKVGGDALLEISGPGSNGNVPMFFSPPGVPSMINPGLRVADSAEIGGVFQYTSDVEQTGEIQAAPCWGCCLPDSSTWRAAKPGCPRKGGSPHPRMDFWPDFREFVTLLVLGGLAVWLLPALLGRWSERVRSEFLPSTGWGLLVVILGYVGAAVVALLILALGIFFGVVTLGGLARTIFGSGLFQP